ncbi:hypothetical protein E5676_scaffold237G001860 [Cucumis melo var. makuwa]|uniref:Uncharacterized protein n=1 Tax=Cucumis melo var. makuwa TaxID=1194695 RepID=A0A5D3DAJ5_CUCMM|nr:hypothetical protein E6C27_scaffold43059G00030 [Cucumis melo var. makuwa]TYK20585.1 hypothetical protein E5676_scaffold237G001860 [Cucumis melo var. makuwa]
MYIAKIFRVDDRSRKGCILVPEGLDKAGWAHFTEILPLIKDTERRRPLLTIASNHETIKGQYSSSSDSGSSKRSYAEVVSNTATSD